MELKYNRKNSYTQIAYNDKETEKKEGVVNVYQGVPVIQFPKLLEKTYIQHGFSTREGGCSEGYLASMNLGFDRGDTKETVKQNYQVFCDALGIQIEKLAFSDQVHEIQIQNVDENHTAGIEFEKKLKGIDGLITNKKEICLTNSYADCVPLLFVDTKNKVIAGSHSGWKGTVKQIGKATVEKMQAEYGSNPADIEVVIGPSICVDCYEVSEDVAMAFKDVFTKEEAETFLFKGKEEGKYQLDLWRANQCSLQNAGIKKENISVACICTCCNSQHLYSHRASNGKRGNLVSMIMLRE